MALRGEKGMERKKKRGGSRFKQKAHHRGSPFSVIKFVAGQKELQFHSWGHVEGGKRGCRRAFFVSEHNFYSEADKRFVFTLLHKHLPAPPAPALIVVLFAYKQPKLSSVELW